MASLAAASLDGLQGKPSVTDEVARSYASKIRRVRTALPAHVDVLLHEMWLHQANLNMNQLIARKVLGRDATEDEAPVILDEYANTSSAGSVIAFHKFSDDLAPGALGMLCSFGAGYSIGSVILEKQ